MAGEFEKLFGPKPKNDTPVNRNNVPAGLLPVNVNHSFVPWPFFPSGPGKSILPGGSGLKRSA